MTRVLSGPNEPSQPDDPDAEFGICITVPEEFTGQSIGELNSRGGRVVEMDAQSGIVLIRASLPRSEYYGLQKAIAANTQHRGRVEHQ
jgi:translation elongation factor EF-G